MSRVSTQSPPPSRNSLARPHTNWSDESGGFKIFLLNLLSLAGFSVAIFLTHHFYQVRNGTAGFKSYCNITSQMNCDVVAASSYAEIFQGLPLSSLAAGWYLAIFLISILAHNIDWKKEAIRVSFIMATVATLASIPYIFIMALTLHTFCLLCLVLDGITLATFFTTLALKPEGLSTRKLDLPKWRLFLVLFAITISATALTSRTLDGGTLPKLEIKELVDSILNSTPMAMKTGAGYPSIGPTTAPITVVEFSDFQCPYCRIGAYAVHSAMNAHLNQVRIEFKNFPLDQACNPEIHQTAHPIACEAARVAMCAQKQGRFEAMYNELFDKQATFAPGRPIELAKETGLNTSELMTCVSSSETAQLVNRDILEALSLGIKSTPTFFVNGYRVEGAYPAPVWNMLFDRLLSK